MRIVYATLDALNLARENPDKRVVFLGVGFETTAPTVAAAIVAAHRQRLHNFFVVFRPTRLFRRRCRRWPARGLRSTVFCCPATFP